MRLAVVSTFESAGWTGCEELWAATAAEAVAAGHQVFCSVRHSSVEPEKLTSLREDGAVISTRRRRFPSPDKVFSRIHGNFVSVPRPHQLSFASRFRRTFSSAPDVVLLSQAVTYDFLYNKDLMEWLRVKKLPYVIVNQLHFDVSLPEANIRRAVRFLRSAFKVAFVSKSNLLNAERQLATALPNAYIAVNPINLADTSVVPPPANTIPSFACVARLDVNHKGHDILLEALSAPVWRERQWLLRFYGEGPDRSYIERLARHYALTKRVTFEGQVADVRSIWAENDLLVLASRMEGTPLALVEAMFCGRPAVVTDIGGNAEWIKNGETGFVAAAPTANSFRPALEKAWARRLEWPRMGLKAHDAAAQRHLVAPGQHLLEVLEAAAESKLH